MYYCPTILCKIFTNLLTLFFLHVGATLTVKSELFLVPYNVEQTAEIKPSIWGAALDFLCWTQEQKITTLSTVKKPLLSLFLLSVQFRENCGYCCSCHWLLLFFLFLSSCIEVRLTLDRIQLNSYLIKKRNIYKKAVQGRLARRMKPDSRDFHPFRAGILKSNSLPIVITLIIIVVTPSIIFLSWRHPIQVRWLCIGAHSEKTISVSVYPQIYFSAAALVPEGIALLCRVEKHPPLTYTSYAKDRLIRKFSTSVFFGMLTEMGAWRAHIAEASASCAPAHANEITVSEDAICKSNRTERFVVASGGAT